jgi:hypothetical protein
MRKWYKSIDHEVSVQVGDDVFCTVTVHAPENMSHWKLVRLGAQKLGLIKPTKKRSKRARK